MTGAEVEAYIQRRKRGGVYLAPKKPFKARVVYDRPLPEDRRGKNNVGHAKHIYPFEEMKAPKGKGVGRVYASFWVPKTIYQIQPSAYKFGKKTGWKFHCRAQSENGFSNISVGKHRRGTRVWRIA